jgi:hypothetical protein
MDAHHCMNAMSYNPERNNKEAVWLQCVCDRSNEGSGSDLV